jgi:endonuclease G
VLPGEGKFTERLGFKSRTKQNLAYFTDTEAGSSGSPACNDRWQVLALHKASTMTLGRYQYQGKDTAWVNIGTTIEKVVPM